MNKQLYSFSLSSQLGESQSEIIQDAFTMAGVNRELFPLVKMTAPKQWQQMPISEWPIGKPLFHSWLLLLGFIPIDRHQFLFADVREDGFIETSSSLTHELWQHERKISSQPEGINVEDYVCYRSRLPILGGILKPIYQAVFRHRHYRLRKRYGVI